MARRWQLRQAAQRLRDAAALASTQGPRRSLRIEWHNDNDTLIAAGREPLYVFVLYGEKGWDVTGEAGYQIIAN